MKYRIDYEMTHDIDFFFKYKGKYYHAASNGQRLPSFIDSTDNRELQMKIELFEDKYDVEWSPDARKLLEEYDLSSFKFYAERGFISLDRVINEDESDSSQVYRVVVRPKDDPNFSDHDKEVLSLLDRAESKEEPINLINF